MNDETPVFDTEEKSIKLSENISPADVNITFGATDGDKNSLLRYRIGDVVAYTGGRRSEPVNVTATGVKVWSFFK